MTIIRARAPLRLGLAGGGTDVSPYCDKFGGQVLNATISLYAYASIEPMPAGQVVFRSADLSEEVHLEASENLPLEGPLPLHRGAYRRIVRQFCRGEPPSVAITTHCDVPPGSGLGSSSTLVVAVMEAFKEYLSLPLGEYDVARLSFEVERLDLGLVGGRQDQYAATFGGFNFIEFYDHERVIVNPLRVREAIVSELEASFVLFFTGASRDSAAIIEEQMRNVRENRLHSVAAMHALKADAVSMKERLLKGDVAGVAEVLGRSWVSKKAMAERIANPTIDRIYDLAIEAGAWSGKVSGAGGGGFMMFVVDPLRRPQLIRALSSVTGQVVSCHFTDQGVSAWRVANGGRSP